ncbi:shikimate dehydrogenase [Candidatus Marinarcus aquaticus]|uniref:Shikimate dehydrogenase (NADP(+)) n=1 Tax=Candidatus Marinarcus aquaticus TaxID=2044504 RepID=A0A4Q0XW64_9BACT|nr:shikimate dehydrogenase [Candidatus Marinarcus aquaticus]RXJ60151.1 shikimate dehydrogenase [Candidatus Marinarcus aquaticus]
MKQFAIFGNPVEHSKSPNMHNNGFKQLNFDAHYIKHHLLNGKEIKEVFLNKGYSGANITVPHKEEAFAQADNVVGVAQKIGAVNTYIKEKDGSVTAYNTDAPGFLKAIESFGKIQNVLILGAGGTAKAIAVALLDAGKKVSVLNRSENKLTFFKELGCNTYSWDNFKPSSYDLVVNSTSAGLKDEYYPVEKTVLEAVLNKSKFAFDCIYGKLTPFLSLAKELGLEYKDGEDMLLYQGVLAFEYFTNSKCSDEIIEAMREGLKK